MLKLLRKKQKRDYERRHMLKTEIKIYDIVLLKSNKPFHQKGRKFLQKWLGPYTVMNISDKVVATLKIASTMILKNKYNIVQRKHHIQEAENKSKSTSNEESAKFWNHTPDKIVETILLYAEQQSKNSSSGHKCETNASIKSTCCKWAHITEGKGPALLSNMYINM